MIRPARSLRLPLAAGGLLLSAALLAGCTSTVPATPGTDQEAGNEGTGGNGPTDAPTCETIIAPSLVEQFDDLGWESRLEPFRIGPHEVPGGITCTWGDFDLGANDIVQMYGWAPLEEDQAGELRDYLADEGWTVEEEGGITYVSESMPSPEWADENGYGMTYAFGDGWVSLADTKSGLDVIVWGR